MPVTEAAEHIINKGLVEEGAPAIVKFIAKIAARFSGPVSQKIAAQSVPLVGAAGGAVINVVFINHFQEMARAHFKVRRLEHKYGKEFIESEYQRIKSSCGA